MGQTNSVRTNRIDFVGTDGTVLKSIYISGGTITLDGAPVGTGSLLTGLAAGTNEAIASTDTVLGALAKLQAQITALGE